jgi:YD repeat-containing protein
MQCGETVGNPIVTALGIKQQSVGLGLKVAGIEFKLTYNSTPLLFARLASLGATATPYWHLNLYRRIFPNTDGTAFNAMRGDGTIVTYFKEADAFVTDGDVTDRLVQVGSNFLIYADREGIVEKYSTNGMLLSIQTLSGREISFAYSDATTPLEVAPKSNMLIGIGDNLAGSVLVRYAPDTGAVSSLTMEGDAQARVGFTYDVNARLSAIEFPDGTTKELEYTNESHKEALTRVTHEDGVSSSVYVYDSKGRAISTGMAGYAATTVSYIEDPGIITTETYDTSKKILTIIHEWAIPSSVSVTPWDGSAVQQSFDPTLGYPRLRSKTQPAGAGCSAAMQTQERDGAGNIIQRDDFNGMRSCYAYGGRNLESARVEGLDKAAVCASLLTTGVALPSTSRKISTQWHPDWRLSTKVAEPKRLVTSVYNGQADPFTGATASCAPSSAVLPDGKPIVVLCKQVEQATTDVDGSLGFSATVQSGVPNRVWQYTYNSNGQVLTATDPLNHTTSYAYYGDTTADHTKGDLSGTTNALGQVTQYPKYNPGGQVLQMVDPNGIVTGYTYDLRQRLTSTSVAGATTSYAYWPTGLLKQVTQPDGSFVAYDYDDAHRLIAVSDKLGNRVEYTLDNSGNRIEETVKDPNGTLSRQLTRVMDALNRVQQTNGRQ